jgi:hypothetical protein
MPSVIKWISAHKQLLIGAFLSLIVMLIIAYRLIAHHNANAELDFLRAQTSFTQFQKNILSDPEAAETDLKQLQDLLKSYPDLRAKYDGAIAQSLLILNQAVKAKPFAEAVFKRTKSDHLNLYQEFSQTSLLIGNGEVQEALQKAKELKLALDLPETAESHPALVAFNLLRLAILHQQLAQKDEERQSWELLENQLVSSRIHSELQKALQIGNTPISQYIEGRKKQLT